MLFSQCLRFWDVKSLNIIDNIMFWGCYLVSAPCQVMNKDSLIYISISCILQENSSSASRLVQNLQWLGRTFEVSPCHKSSFYSGHGDSCAWNCNRGTLPSPCRIPGLSVMRSFAESVTFSLGKGVTDSPESPSQEHSGLDGLSEPKFRL